MPDYNIQVKLDPRNAVTNARVVERSINRIDNAANKLRNTLTEALKLAGIGFALNELAQLADAYTNIQNRIKIVTDSQEELVQVTEDLFDIAQRTRGSFESSVQLYAKLETSTQSLGISQEELLRVTESVNQAVALSGSTAAASEAGLIQFAQGLSLGRFQAEELNSVLEQIPVVADVIAKELGVARGELKNLTQEGVITAETVLRAFQNSREELEEQFSRTIPTLSQAFAVLRNSFIKLVGDFEDSAGITQTLARSIIALAENIETLTKVILASLAAWASYKAAVVAVPFLAAVSSSLQYSRAVASGRAVVLGSAQAEAQKAAAIRDGIAEQLAATQATLSRTRAEASRSVVLRDTIELERQRAILLSRVSTLERQAAAQQTALTGAIQTVRTATGAELERAQAIIRTTTVQTAQTKATLARTKGELAGLKTTDNARNAEFARIAVLKQIESLEGDVANQTKNLTRATNAQAAANVRASRTFSRLSDIFPELTSAVNTLTAAIARNPIGAIAVALTAAIGLLVLFRNDIQLATDGLATLGDAGTVVWGRIKTAIEAVIIILEERFRPISELAERVFGDIEFSIAGLVLFVAREIDKFVNFWAIGFKVVGAVVEGFPDFFEKATAIAFNAAIDKAEEGINSLVGLFNQLFDRVGASAQLAQVTFKRIETTAGDASFKIGELIGQAIREGVVFSGVERFVAGIFDEAEEIAQERQRRAAAAEAERQRQEAERQRAALARQRAQEAETFFALIDGLMQEAALLKEVSSERQILQGIIDAENELKRELTGTEEELLEALLRENQALELQASLYEQIKAPILEYQNTLAALNALADQGRITQEEYNAALRETALAVSLQGIRADIGGEASPTAQLATQLAERQLILDQALEARLLSEQEFLTLSLQINEDYNQRIAEIEQQRFRTQLQAGQNAFSALANTTKGFAGEQSGVYRGLFAASKAFAVADTTIAIIQGIANAAKLGWPANIGAIAATIAQTAGLISQIQGVNATGFQDGGTFRVGGAGGADSQLVQFRASPNESVSIRTPGQERADLRAMAEGQQQPEFNLTNVNVVDNNLLEDFLVSPQGDRILVNAIRRNRTQTNGVLGRR